MTDMLVKLYALPPLAPLAAALARNAVVMRRPLAYEKHLVTTWFGGLFGAGWASECETAFSRLPVACFIATQEDRIAGAACYDCTCRNFFGPIGVAPTWRGRRIGGGPAAILSARHGGGGVCVRHYRWRRAAGLF
ncbi:MAG: hypothetical protein R6X05_14575 [Desulfobacterales bacterium]